MLRLRRQTGPVAEIPQRAGRQQRHLGRFATLDAAPAVHETSIDLRLPGCSLSLVVGVLRLVLTLVRTKPGETLRATVSMSDCNCASY